MWWPTGMFNRSVTLVTESSLTTGRHYMAAAQAPNTDSSTFYFYIIIDNQKLHVNISQADLRWGVKQRKPRKPPKAEIRGVVFDQKITPHSTIHTLHTAHQYLVLSLIPKFLSHSTSFLSNLLHIQTIISECYFHRTIASECYFHRTIASECYF